MPWLTPDARQEAVEAARDIVLRRLDRSSAPRAALADLLARKEIAPDIADEVLDRLTEVGLIDDADYAARLARTRFAQKGAARRAIAEELQRKGLSSAHIAAALETIDDADEQSAARRLAVKKLRMSVGLEPHVRRRRTLAYLGRKGYSAAVAHAAYQQALADSQILEGNA